MSNELSIVPLNNDPRDLEIVAAWLFGEWGHLEAGRSLEETLERLRQRADRTKPPLTLVAMANDRPVGTASLTPWDMRTRPDLSPWLSSVFVDPESRGYGVGSRLVNAIEETARDLAIPTLYLFTPDRENFYRRLGWETMEWCEYRGEKVVLMRKHTGALLLNAGADTIRVL